MLHQSGDRATNLANADYAVCGNLDRVDDFGHRLRAARAYADLSQQELADAIGLSATTLRRIEAGVKTLRPFELKTYSIAMGEACGLPGAFFTADFSQLQDDAASNDLDQKLDSIIERLERIEAVGQRFSA